jgi:hypothetical protein
MTLESSKPDETDEEELGWHRQMDRHAWDEFWDSPTFEKWRKGGKWT